MANPFRAALSGAQVQPSGHMSFIQFMAQNRGKNPNEMLQQLMSSGKINQNQLNQVQQMAKQVETQLDSVKSMFGF